MVHRFPLKITSEPPVVGMIFLHLVHKGHYTTVHTHRGQGTVSLCIVMLSLLPICYNTQANSLTSMVHSVIQTGLSRTSFPQTRCHCTNTIGCWAQNSTPTTAVTTTMLVWTNKAAKFFCAPISLHHGTLEMNTEVLQNVNSEQNLTLFFTDVAHWADDRKQTACSNCREVLKKLGRYFRHVWNQHRKCTVTIGTNKPGFGSVILWTCGAFLIDVDS